ncbi:hypothetical protein NL676_031524 [Syzygium grande]|nr:hypothetical protein NL676_031524 [Syzygium grande]
MLASATCEIEAKRPGLAFRHQKVNVDTLSPRAKLTGKTQSGGNREKANQPPPLATELVGQKSLLRVDCKCAEFPLLGPNWWEPEMGGFDPMRRGHLPSSVSPPAALSLSSVSAAAPRKPPQPHPRDVESPARIPNRRMGDEKKPKPAGVWPTVKPFVNGGASGMLATCVIQPIDMIKVRIQLGQGSAGQVTKTMLKEEGVGAFYKGLSAGLLRQATYTTARLGSFRILTAKAIEANDGKPLPLYQKALCGLTAGAIGACVGSPADLALIRMQADATLPAAQRRHYTNAFHALYRIVGDEGVLALWKGAGPTVVRAMALNMGMLASYDQSVEFFKDSLGFGEGATILGASTVSGFFAAACSLPFDYVKTQIQKMQPDAAGKYPYTGSLDCAMKTLKAGGPFKFYTGFPVYCVRIAPHVMMTWIFLNQIQKIEKSIGL